MRNCQVENRTRARKAAAALDADPRVIAVDTIAPARDPTDRWTLDVVLRLDLGGVPAPVLAVMAEHGLTLRDAGPQGGHWQALAVVGGERA